MNKNGSLQRLNPGSVLARLPKSSAIPVIFLGLIGIIGIGLIVSAAESRVAEPNRPAGQDEAGWRAARRAPGPVTTLSGDEKHPAIDYNLQINSYLVAWEDQQTDYSISGMVVGVDGIPRSDPFNISEPSPDKCLAPDIVCNRQTGECLAVWEHALEEGLIHDIIARRVEEDGSPAGSAISLTASLGYATSPAAAYNLKTGEWLVVWDRAQEVHDRDIEAAILDGEGNVQASITIAQGTDDQANPSVAFGSKFGEYLVVWEDRQFTSENPNLAAQRVGGDGSLVGNPLPVSTWEYEQINPRLDYNPDLDEFMVVWEDHHWAWGAAADIYGQRISAKGGLVGGNFGISWEGSERRLNPDIAYKGETQEYLVTWEYETTQSDHDVYQRRVSKEAKLPASEAPITNLNSWEGLPALASGSELAFLVVWEDYRNQAAQKADIYGEVLVPISPPTTATPTPTPTLKPSLTPTLTPSPTRTPTPTPTPSLTPTPTEKPSLDLQVEAVELTQAIQCKDNGRCKDGDNAVPMISGKATYVRVYVKVTGSSSAVPGVSAVAIAKVGYDQIIGIPLNPTIEAQLVPDRSKFGDTLNFYFPADDLSSSGAIKVIVNPDRLIPEASYANNARTVPVNFVQTLPLKIVPIWVYYKWGGHSSYVNQDMPWWMNNYTENILPVGEVYWLNLPGSSMKEWNHELGPDEASWGKLLNAVQDMENKNFLWSYLSKPVGFAHFFGMFPKGQQNPFNSISGYGDQPGRTLVGLVEMYHQNLEDMADNMVHELGHNFDLSHAPCDVTDADPNYPFPTALLGDIGWDPQGAGGGKVQSLPDGWVTSQIISDVMSYCQDEWISEYTYRNILDYRGSAPLERANQELGMLNRVSASQDTWSYLFVSGILSDRLELDPLAILDFPSGYHSQEGEGAYQLRLVDAEGGVLFTRNFDMQKSTASYLPGASASPQATPWLSFSEILPWDPDTASIEIWHGDTLLAERLSSDNAPNVELLEPQGGETWKAGEDYSITWTAGDDDEDALWFDVAFSPDGGESWAVIASRYQGTSLEVHGDDFPGAEQAVIRVYASDGFHTSQATSASFVIEAKGPTVLITLPEDGASVPPGFPVMLTGSAFDWEDGPLSGDSLSWSSDQGGALGTGEEILADLAPGWNVITLAATDSDGLSDRAAIHIHLGYRTLLPLVRN